MNRISVNLWLFVSAMGLALLLFMFGCASIESGRSVTPTRLELANTLVLPFEAGKALLDGVTNTYYITEKDRPNIYFWRDGNRINTIGGLGGDTGNFRKLTDISLDPDGNLLALDSFAKLIRKYTPDGRWIADIDLASFNQPEKFCSTPDGDFIIYDSATQELSQISGLDYTSVFSFGRFQVESVSSLTVSRDYIAVVDETGDRSVLFSALGEFLDEYPYQMVLDRYRNRYVYKEGAVRHLKEDVLVPLGWENREVRLYSTPESILVVKGNSVLTIYPGFAEN